MSLKAVELQIALPKTFEAGKVSESLLQQSLLQQEAAKSEMERQLMKTRTTVTTSLAAEKIRRDGSRDRKEPGKRDKRSGQQNLHPFKGNHVDYMG